MTRSSPVADRPSDPFAAFGELGDRANIAHALRERAREHPERDAIRVPGPRGWRATSYAELEERSDHVAAGLAGAGVRRGDRACVFVRPGVDLIAITYGLFKLGAVPVLLDPGMGRKPMLACIERMAPRVFIGISLAHVVRVAMPSAFRSVEIPVTVGRRVGWRGPTLDELTRLAAREPGPFEIADTEVSDPAAILFTSGSTGPPKGVTYAHGMFEAQRHALRDLYAFRPGEVDVACFPLFALFDTALGMTSVFPELDPSRPGRCDPAKVAEALLDTGATLTFGSPAIWRRVAPYCAARGVRFDDLERVLIAGAPVPPQLIAELRELLPNGDVHTPYGATESLPVASVSGREIEELLRPRTERGEGTCVGRVAPGIDLRVIAITDEPIPSWSDARELPGGELGELCVRGPVVTQEYADEPGPTALAKIADPAGGPAWHRMGDLGYVDGDGRVWFCGRKSHRLETADGTRPCVPTENVFNTLRGVRRSALVGVGAPGAQRPILIVEPEGPLPRGRAADLRARALLDDLGGAAVPVTPERILFHPAFPVDVRHNAKIHRSELRTWAAEQLG